MIESNAPSWRDAIKELKWYHTLFDISPLPMCIADQDGATLIRANRAYCDMIGRDSLDGVSWLDLMWNPESPPIPPEEWDSHGKTVKSDVEQRTDAGEWIYTSWLVTRFVDGERMIATAIGRVVFGPAKERPDGFWIPRKDYWSND